MKLVMISCVVFLLAVFDYVKPLIREPNKISPWRYVAVTFFVKGGVKIDILPEESSKVAHLAMYVSQDKELGPPDLKNKYLVAYYSFEEVLNDRNKR